MSHPPPEPPDVSKTGGNPATDKEPVPSTAYGYDDRVVTLMPRHYFIEHIALEDLPVQGSDSDSDSSAPARPTRVDPVFTEATLIIVPTLRKAVVDNADDCGDGNKPRNTLCWDIVLWDPSHKTAVLKRLPDQISYELLDRDAAAEYIYGGIVRGRFTKERDRDRVQAALQKLAGPLTDNVENPLAWANDIVKGLARTLRGRMELSLRGCAIDNDNLRLIDLMDIVARDHTVKHYLEYQDYTVVDRILLETRLKWSGTAYPPCALSLVHSSADIEYDIILPPGANLNWKVQSLAPLPPDKMDSAILLIPYKREQPPGGDSPVAWKIAIVALDTWKCRTVFVTEVGGGVRSYGVVPAEYTEKERNDQPGNITDERGGILLGYCRKTNDPKTNADQVWDFLRADEDKDVNRDTLIWAKETLLKVTKHRLIIAPDRSSTAQPEWMEMLFDYLETALSRKAGIRVVVGGREESTSLEHIIQGYDICDEQFLALKRQMRRVLHSRKEQGGQRQYGDTSVLPTPGGRGGPSSNSAAPYYARWLPDNYPGAPHGSVTSRTGMIRPQTNQYRYSDARGNNYRG